MNRLHDKCPHDPRRLGLLVPFLDTGSFSAFPLMRTLPNAAPASPLANPLNGSVKDLCEGPSGSPFTTLGMKRTGSKYQGGGGHGAQGEADSVQGKSLASPCDVDWLDVLFGWRRSGCPLGSRWSCLLAPGLLLQDLRDLGFQGVQIVGESEDPGLLGGAGLLFGG